MKTAVPLIDFEHLTLLREGRVVLRDLTLKMDRGEHLGILGPNGSGKSSLIQLITRQLYPVQDTKRSVFRMFGEDQWNVFDLRAYLGIVSNDLQPFHLRDISGEDVILSGFFSSVGLWPHHQVTEAMRRRMRSILRFLEVPHLAGRSILQMSSGEARRFLIGRALVHDPQALILDEPTNSLDLRSARDFRGVVSKIARSGKSVILVTHHVEDIIPEINRVVMLLDGRIFQDGPKSKVLTSALLSKLLNARLRISRQNGYYHLR